MMNYDVFKEVAVERINSFLPPLFADFKPHVESVRKVNELKDAMTLRPEGNSEIRAFPMVYLDDMYELFKEDEDLDAVLEYMAQIIISFTGSLPDEAVNVDFANKKQHVIVSLVNREKNIDLISGIPHCEFVDLAAIYRVIMSTNTTGIDTVVVNRSIQESMGLSDEELRICALKNSKEMFPATITELEEGVFVISNEFHIYGAAAMLYSGVLEEVAEKMGCEEFYILPGSIHELLAVSKDRADPQHLVEMLAEANTTTTGHRQVLSNSIYAYNNKMKAIGIAASYRCKLVEEAGSETE